MFLVGLKEAERIGVFLIGVGFESQDKLRVFEEFELNLFKVKYEDLSQFSCEYECLMIDKLEGKS